MSDLYAAWIAAKEAERQATETRRAIEDEILLLTALPSAFEGTKTVKADEYKIKVVGRFNRKVDSKKLQDIAAEHGLINYLPHLFRWSADINKAAWEAADAKITTLLLGAITTTPSRPSFIIAKEKD